MDIYSTRWKVHLIVGALLLGNVSPLHADLEQKKHTTSNTRLKPEHSATSEKSWPGDAVVTHDNPEILIGELSRELDAAAALDPLLAQSTFENYPEMSESHIDATHNIESSIPSEPAKAPILPTKKERIVELGQDAPDEGIPMEWSVLIDKKFVHDEVYIDKLAKKFNCRNFGKVLTVDPLKEDLVYYRFVQEPRKASKAKSTDVLEEESDGDRISPTFNALVDGKKSRVTRDIEAFTRRKRFVHLPRCIQNVKLVKSHSRVKRGFIDDHVLLSPPLPASNPDTDNHHQPPSHQISSNTNRSAQPSSSTDQATADPTEKFNVHLPSLDFTLASHKKAHHSPFDTISPSSKPKTAAQQRFLDEKRARRRTSPTSAESFQNSMSHFVRVSADHQIYTAVHSSPGKMRRRRSTDAHKKEGGISKRWEWFFNTFMPKPKPKSRPPEASRYQTVPKLETYAKQDRPIYRPKFVVADKPPPPIFNDPLYKTSLWYYDLLNITGAWALGYTGKGVTISVLDDGIEFTHPDLDENFSSEASWDVNSGDGDPSPRYTRDNTNKHGTRCSGVIAAEANNSICIPGIAYHANIGGIRMLDGTVNDQVEAQSIGFRNNIIDIYSSSWGPDDDGKTVDGPGYLTKRAFDRGVKYGRQNKGNIYVWASGNGGRFTDSCAADGYANSIYTVSTSSASHEGRIPWYNEPCASTIATAYSSNNNNNDPKVATTDIRGKCTDQHTGTSAAAPMIVGVIALALEANPDLTWRAVQHLLIRTATPGNLIAHDWRVNEVGRSYSHNFGYGLINGGHFVEAARDWSETLPAQRMCIIDLLPERSAKIPHSDRISVRRLFTQCQNGEDITSLEHVILETTLAFGRRGDIEINLISPGGTLSKMHPRRPHDSRSIPYNNWPFMSVHFWDEQPYGSWTVELKNAGVTRARGVVHKLRLKLYGTFSNRRHRELSHPYKSIQERYKSVQQQPAIQITPDGDANGAIAGPGKVPVFLLLACLLWWLLARV